MPPVSAVGRDDGLMNGESLATCPNHRTRRGVGNSRSWALEVSIDLCADPIEVRLRAEALLARYDSKPLRLAAGSADVLTPRLTELSVRLDTLRS